MVLAAPETAATHSQQHKNRNFNIYTVNQSIEKNEKSEDESTHQ
jgi:hypothetical protein